MGPTFVTFEELLSCSEMVSSIEECGLNLEELTPLKHGLIGLKRKTNISANLILYLQVIYLRPK